MIYLDDRLPTHPKLLQAGDLLGPGGMSQAFHLYVLGISYARANLTDGFLPRPFLGTCAFLSLGVRVAEALCDRRVKLWSKVKGGYRIHDFHDFNPKASLVKQKRAKDAARKRAERAAAGNGHLSSVREVSIVDDPRTTCARGTTIHVPHKDRDSADPSNWLLFDPAVVIPAYGLSAALRAADSTHTKLQGEGNAPISISDQRPTTGHSQTNRRSRQQRFRMAGPHQMGPNETAAVLPVAPRGQRSHGSRRSRPDPRTGTTAPARPPATGPASPAARPPAGGRQPVEHPTNRGRQWLHAGRGGIPGPADAGPRHLCPQSAGRDPNCSAAARSDSRDPAGPRSGRHGTAGGPRAVPVAAAAIATGPTAARSRTGRQRSAAAVAGKRAA